jgi:hypothetical protein
MRGYLWIPVCAMALTVPVAVLAGGGERGFNGVVDAIEAQYHVRATRIPFMGLISLVAHKASHGAAANLHVAEFDNFHADVDGQELDRMVEEKLDAGWERVVLETSKAGHEQTLVFMRPEGARMGLFVVDKDGNELDVVQVSVDPRHVDDDIGHYTHHHEHASGDSDHDKGDGEGEK